MKNRLQLIILILTLSWSVTAQINRTGVPLISWFDAAETPGDLVNRCITMDKRGVIYFGNETTGIVTYDGHNWGLIPMPGLQRVTALASDHRGLVYVGAESDFGFLQPVGSGDPAFNSLADRITDSLLRSEVGLISSIAADSNMVLFADTRKLYQYDLSGDSVYVSDMDSEYGIRSVSVILAAYGKVIVADNRQGLFEYSDSRLVPVPGGEGMRMVRFVTLLPYDSDNILVVTAENGLMLYNHRTGTVNSKFADPYDTRILTAGVITAAVTLPGRNVAVGLSGGGIYIFSHEGTLLQHISGTTAGLRESTVTAMYCDYASNSQLWFCTRGFINRAYISLPANEFGAESGIESPPRDIVQFGTSTYVAGDNGIYRSYTDSTQVIRFTQTDLPAGRVSDLEIALLPDDTLLLAAASDGLWQLRADGSAFRLLARPGITVVRADRNDASAVIAGSSDGIVRTLRYSAGGWKVVNSSLKNLLPGRIKVIEQSAPGEWWMLTSSAPFLTRMSCNEDDTLFISYDRSNGIECDTLSTLSYIDGTLYLGTGKGIYRYEDEEDRFTRDSKLTGSTFDKVMITTLFKAPGGDLYLSGFDGRHFDALVNATSQGHVVFRKQFDFLPDVASGGITEIDGNIWITKGRKVYVLDKSKLGFNYGAFSTLFTSVASGENQLMKNAFYTETPTGVRIPSTVQPEENRPVLKAASNNITFSWTTTSYAGEDKTEYMYKLEGFDLEWSKWERRNLRDYTSLPGGSYLFRLKAKTVTGLESREVTYGFRVMSRWYASLPAILLYLGAGSLLLFLIMRMHSSRVKERSRKLEILLGNRDSELERVNSKMESVSAFAGTIQRALLPPEKSLQEAFPNCFVLNRPRGPVGGDFYWTAERDNRILIAVGDCTGHGISSALLTLMGITLLRDAFNSRKKVTAEDVLDTLHARLTESLKPSDTPDGRPETMEIAIIIVDRKSNTVEFSGAGLHCFRVRALKEGDPAERSGHSGELAEGVRTDGKYLIETMYGDRIPAGARKATAVEFTRQEWNLEKDSSYYLFTDGYSDQFNGITGKKFMRGNFRNLLLEIQNFPMSRQKEILDERLLSWKGSAQQTDDILVLGFRIE
jgi:ligand-binding sensor domain-containing protein